MPTKTDTIANGHKPDELAGKFPSPNLVAIDVPLTTAKEVDNAAQALAERVAAAFTEMEGQPAATQDQGVPPSRSASSARLRREVRDHDLRHTYDSTVHDVVHHQRASSGRSSA